MPYNTMPLLKTMIMNSNTMLRATYLCIFSTMTTFFLFLKMTQVMVNPIIPKFNTDQLFLVIRYFLESDQNDCQAKHISSDTRLLFLIETQIRQGKDFSSASLVLCNIKEFQIIMSGIQAKNAHHHFLVLTTMWYLITHIYPTHSLIVLVSGKRLWNCNFSLGIFIASLCSWHRFTWITIRCNIHWLVVLSFDCGKLTSCGSSTIHFTTMNLPIYFFFVIMQWPSRFSLTRPEARILFEAKNLRR